MDVCGTFVGDLWVSMGHLCTYMDIRGTSVDIRETSVGSYTVLLR